MNVEDNCAEKTNTEELNMDEFDCKEKNEKNLSKGVKVGENTQVDNQVGNNPIEKSLKGEKMSGEKMSGKKIRMSRITKNGRAVIIPMDHGTTIGPVQGIENMNNSVPLIDKGGATGLVLHKGIIKNLRQVTSSGVIMHISASTKLSRDSDKKVLVGSVDEAVRLGADAVSVHVNIGGNENEPDMLSDLGRVADDCDRMQMPLLVMAYPRGDNVNDGMDVENVAMVARVAAELGADIVKTNYTGDPESFKRVTRGCPVPVVIAGGPKCETDRDILEMVKGAMQGGAAGISLGRNAFQHDNPEKIVKALRQIIVEDKSVDDALKVLEE